MRYHGDLSLQLAEDIRRGNSSRMCHRRRRSNRRTRPYPTFGSGALTGTILPSLPLPEESPTASPEPSLNFQWATKLPSPSPFSADKDPMFGHTMPKRKIPKTNACPVIQAALDCCMCSRKILRSQNNSRKGLIRRALMCVESIICSLSIAHSQQAPGIGFPRRRAGPNGQNGYRSSSEDHTPAGSRTSDNRSSVRAQCR